LHYITELQIKLYFKFVKIYAESPVCQHRNPGFTVPCPYRAFQGVAAAGLLPVKVKRNTLTLTVWELGPG
jgi:hypothetical protein